MYINYFDLGLNNGEELFWAINFLPKITAKHRVFGFEPVTEHFEKIKKKTKQYSNVRLVKCAISNKNGEFPIYIAPNTVGHSLFSTKNNVNKNKIEMTKCIIFSEWLQKTVPTFKDDFNIMHVNIEGAEWYLFHDIIEKKINKCFDIYCGAGHDVNKIGELKDRFDYYVRLLEDNDIKIHRFCLSWHPERNVDIGSMIKKSYTRRARMK